MSKVSLKADATHGYNFNCPLPHFWFTYNIGGTNYIKVEMLVWWGTDERDIYPQMSADGKYLFVTAKIPDPFLGVTHYWKHKYKHALSHDEESYDNMYQGAQLIIQDIKETNDMEDVASQIELKLPFQCKQCFHDPYEPQSEGYELAVYPLKEAGYGSGRQVYIFHINLVDAKESQKDTNSTPFRRAYGFLHPGGHNVNNQALQPDAVMSD